MWLMIIWILIFGEEILRFKIWINLILVWISDFLYKAKHKALYGILAMNLNTGGNKNGKINLKNAIVFTNANIY